MKKMILCSIAAALIAAPVFADTAHHNYSAVTLSKADHQTRHRNIVVNNYSDNYIYETVPAGNLTDIVVYPNRYQNIVGDDSFDVEIILEDIYHHVFFDRFVCSHAIIDAYGTAGYNYWRLDQSYC